MEEFYTPESVKKAYQKFFERKAATLDNQIIKGISLALNMEKVGVVCIYKKLVNCMSTLYT